MADTKQYKHGEKLPGGMIAVRSHSKEWLLAVKSDTTEKAIPFYLQHAIMKMAHPECFGCNKVLPMAKVHPDLPNIFLCYTCNELLKEQNDTSQSI